MALLKGFEVHNTGVIATYWRIIQLDFDYESKEIRVLLKGYLTAEDRQAQKNDIHVKEVMLPISAHGEARDVIYTFLETTEGNEFYGATEI